MANSYGILETKGRAASFFGLDKMLKYSNIEFITSISDLGAGLSSVIIKGSTSDLSYALKKGKEEAEKINNVLAAVEINNIHPELESFILNLKMNNKTKKENSLNNNAVALIEIFTFSAALKTADQVLKAADINLLAVEKSKGLAGTPGLILSLKFSGNVDALNSAKELALATADNYYGSPAAEIIANPLLSYNYLSKEGI